jgi:hypothetical protein
MLLVSEIAPPLVSETALPLVPETALLRLAEAASCLSGQVPGLRGAPHVPKVPS